MPDRISRARLSTDPALLHDQARLLLSTPLGGLTLLNRQLNTLRAIGIAQVQLCVPGAERSWMASAAAAMPPIPDITLEIVADTPEQQPPAAPTLVMPADLLIDPRALRQAITSVNGSASLICVDRVPAQYSVDLKSPYVVGAPGAFDGRLL